MESSSGVLRIGELARRTGVAVPTLRAWERRYSLLDPDRTEGGHRLYSERDIERVLAMSRFLDDGWSAAAAARQVLRAPAPVRPLRSVPAAGVDTAAAELVDRIVGAIDVFDGPATDAVIDDVFARFEVARALDEVILPAMRRIGQGWQDDPRLIAREHFATNSLRPRLLRLLRSGALSAGRSCLAAAPEDEDHDLGLLSGCAVAAQAGWRIHYLGARTPAAALERSIAQLRPTVVMIGALFREHAEAFLDDQPEFGGVPVVLGGNGFVDEDQARISNSVHHVGPLADLPATLDRSLVRHDSVG